MKEQVIKDRIKDWLSVDSAQHTRTTTEQINLSLYVPTGTNGKLINGCSLSVIYLCGFFWALSQKSPHAVLESLHVHFLCCLGIIDFNLVDLHKQAEPKICKFTKKNAAYNVSTVRDYLL